MAEAHPDSELAAMKEKAESCTPENYETEAACLADSDKHCEWNYSYEYVYTYENDER